MTISREQFERERHRRFGVANPERMRIAYWEWMVRRGGNAWSARQDILGPDDSWPDKPDWCFERFGMSRTRMPDGRIICIAGEHEDFYDPDFCIYNDVIVLRPAAGAEWVTLDSGEVEIYGYPSSVFPPTDFHTATVVGSQIHVIGSLGYMGSRHDAVTPIVTVDTASYRIEPFKTVNQGPGWLSRHHASYDASTHSITVRGGRKHISGPKDEYRPSFAVHRLHLADCRWELVTQHEPFRQFKIERDPDDSWQRRGPSAECFRPTAVPCDWLEPENRGVPCYFISLHGVRVRMMEMVDAIEVLAEGQPPTDLLIAALDEIAGNLERETGARWTVVEVPFNPDAP